ncbi:MAG: reverse transcriptase domain-containing protein [Actinomycetota bacterium]
MDHDLLRGFLEERISDRRVLKLISTWLRAGVLEGSTLLHPETGSPQGGPLSPLLSNVYLHQFDRRWKRECWRLGVEIRYADDAVILCPTRERALSALEALRSILASLGLELAEEKTRLVDLGERGQGFDFLGFHHRRVESFRRKGRYFCARWPSKQAVRAAKDRIRFLTDRRLLFRPMGEVVRNLNRFLVGWQGFFCRGNSTQVFKHLDYFVLERMARFLSKRHGHSGNGYGLRILYESGYGALHRLVGTVRYG